VPDFDAMNAAARPLVGTHHFGAFCRTQSATENRVCTVHEAVWEPEARPGDWRFRVEADRFLHGMVRAFVGTLLLVGRGQLSAAEIPEIVASRDRRRAGPAAPPHGLVLERVEYPAA
jgi:tRNA pseudouridine38-40 synthase